MLILLSSSILHPPLFPSSAFSFLSESNQGFTVGYPSISLHAVSRSMPSSLEAIANGASTSTNGNTNGHSSSNSSNLACLYCQISNGEDQEDETEEEDGIGNETELWILPSNADSRESFFTRVFFFKIKNVFNSLYSLKFLSSQSFLFHRR